MAKVIWSDQALQQLDQIISYIDVFDPAAAQRIGHQLRSTGEGLRDFPNRGRPVLNGAREMVTVPPYIMRYRVVGDDVVILRIRHSARLPEDDLP